MEDLLESIVGNIQDEYDHEEAEISQLDEQTYEIDGTMDLDEVAELLDIKIPEDLDAETLGGLMMSEIGYIPREGTHPEVTLDQIKFTVLEMDDKRIAKVRVERLNTPSGTETRPGKKPKTE